MGSTRLTRRERERRLAGEVDRLVRAARQLGVPARDTLDAVRRAPEV